MSAGNRQSDKFATTACELDCDESEEAFTEVVRKVAKAPLPEKAAKPARLAKRKMDK